MNMFGDIAVEAAKERLLVKIDAKMAELDPRSPEYAVALEIRKMVQAEGD